MEGNGLQRFACPGEKELEIAGVVDVGGGVGTSASQPPVEAFNFGEHNCTSCGEL